MEGKGNMTKNNRVISISDKFKNIKSAFDDVEKFIELKEYDEIDFTIEFIKTRLSEAEKLINGFKK